MNREELHTLIAQTVRPNNKKQINAESLANLFYEMVDATPEGGSGNAGGSGALKVWIEDAENGIFITEEQKAENVATYNVLIEGEHVPVIVCSKYEMSEEGFSISQTTTHSVSYVTFKYGVSGENTEAVMFFIGDDMENGLTLYPDGTTEISFQHEQSNGQLVIYSGTINADGTATLSDEEKSANMSVYNALMSGQVMPIVYKQDLTQVMGYARIWSNVVADVYPEYGVQIKASYAASLGALESQNFVLNPDGTLDFDAI